MSTLTLKEIIFLWDKKAITAERMRELLTDVKEPQAKPKVHERSMTTFKSRKQGKPHRSHQRYSIAETAQIQKGLENGYTYKAIAKTLGRSGQAIKNWAHVMKSQNKQVRSTGGGQTGMQL